MEGRGDRDTEPKEGKMAEPLNSGNISTRLQRIATMARERPDRAFRSIQHVIDMEWLKEAHRRTRKDGAAGVDGRTADEYAVHLEDNLQHLLDRLKSGTYRAPPVRRVHIPKGDGRKTRPIGVPTFEDKILQRAVAMLMSAIYEQDFLDCSYGFRPGRSAHDALEAVWKGIMSMNGAWVVEADIEGFFDAVDHGHLRSFLDRRVTDGVIRRVVHKWLKAGVMEQGSIRYPEAGTPQGGVISPLLANVMLHEVLDVWFAEQVAPRLRGRAQLVRFADDFVVICQLESDARRVMSVLPKRFERFGLRLHPDKTRVVRFERPRRGGDDGPEPPRPETFDLLGFTHYWGRSRKGSPVVKRLTANTRLRRALARVWRLCKLARHDPLDAQRAMLARQLQGHYAYYGITGNARRLGVFYFQVMKAWHNALRRRGGRRQLGWARFNAMLSRYPLPTPRVVHSAYRRSANP